MTRWLRRVILRGPIARRKKLEQSIIYDRLKIYLKEQGSHTEKEAALVPTKDDKDFRGDVDR